MSYTASEQLEAFVLRRAPPHVAVPDAPSTLAQLKEWAKRNPKLPIPVWNGGSENTIYSSSRVNYAFRAWHDTLHLRLNAEFDRAGELRVSQEHVLQARIYGYLSYEDLAALWADTWGQFEYHEKYGFFPENQAKFVAEYINQRRSKL